MREAGFVAAGFEFGCAFAATLARHHVLYTRHLESYDAAQKKGG